MVIREQVYRVADLWEISHRPENDVKRIELVEGVIVMAAAAGAKHGGIASKLDRLVGDFVDQHQLGYTTAAETGFVLEENPDGRDTVRAPDVGFIRAERLPDGLPDQYVPIAPDLAVEVVSPHDTASEIHEKVTDYLRHGTALVWVAYPKSRTIAAHTSAGSVTLGVDDTLDGGDILPGFKVKVSEIFVLSVR